MQSCFGMQPRLVRAFKLKRAYRTPKPSSWKFCKLNDAGWRLLVFFRTDERMLRRFSLALRGKGCCVGLGRASACWYRMQKRTGCAYADFQRTHVKRASVAHVPGHQSAKESTLMLMLMNATAIRRGKTEERLRKDRGKTVERPWKDRGKTVERPWKDCGKVKRTKKRIPVVVK